MCRKKTARPISHWNVLYIGRFILMQKCHFLILKLILLARHNMQRQNKPFGLWHDQNTALLENPNQWHESGAGLWHTAALTVKLKYEALFYLWLLHHPYLFLSLWGSLWSLLQSCELKLLFCYSCVHVLLYPWFYKRKSTHFSWQ